MIYTPKGRRTSTAPTKVPEVETMPCGDQLHTLSNRVEAGMCVTRCVGCGRTWAELDAEARG